MGKLEKNLNYFCVGTIFLSLAVYFVLVSFGVHKSKLVGDLLSILLLFVIPFLLSIVLFYYFKYSLLGLSALLYPIFASFFYFLLLFFNHIQGDVSIGGMFFIALGFGFFSIGSGVILCVCFNAVKKLF